MCGKGIPATCMLQYARSYPRRSDLPYLAAMTSDLAHLGSGESGEGKGHGAVERGEKGGTER